MASERLAEAALARRLARLSATEMVAAAGLGRAPAPLRQGARLAFLLASRRLARALARFDAGCGERGLVEAAAAALATLRVRLIESGPAVPPEGPLLVVANHPGAYDALALFAALGRRDLAVITLDRDFLRALPHLAPHLVRLRGDGPAARAATLRAAREHLVRGGCLLHFAAGRIEPDPDFAAGGELLGAWAAGTGALVRGAAASGAEVVVAVVRGVHSPRARAHPVARLALARGLDAVPALLQVALPGFDDVVVRVARGPSEPASRVVAAGDAAAITLGLRRRALDRLAPG